MPNSTSDDTATTGSAAPADDLRWLAPDPTVPLEQLTDRQLIARAEHCEEIARSGSREDRTAAMRELDAAWNEAEHRAAEDSPLSVPAQVAGCIGLVREDYDHALAAETTTWRNQLDAVLPLDGRSSDDRGKGDREAASAIAERDGHVVFDPTVPGGFPALTADEQQVLSAAASPSRSDAWNADQHGAYLAGRPDAEPDQEQLYNPAAEYGDDDWREPASDEEAAARTVYLRDYLPPASGWTSRPLTEVEDAIEDSAERAVLSDRAHDHDPYAWAEYDRLLALDSLAPLPTERDALDDLHDDEYEFPPARDRELVLRDHRIDQPMMPRAAGHPNAEIIRCGPFGPDLHELRAGSRAEAEAEQRREQLNRWHDDDRGALEASDADRGESDTGDAGAAEDGGPGRNR